MNNLHLGGEVGWIYLIHFKIPYKHAKHYQGWARNIADRLARHVSLAPQRQGSALMRAVIGSAIEYKVVRVWRGTRDDERRVHERRSAVKRCPICVGRAKFDDFACLSKSELNIDATPAAVVPFAPARER